MRYTKEIIWVKDQYTLHVDKIIYKKTEKCDILNLSTFWLRKFHSVCKLICSESTNKPH